MLGEVWYNGMKVCTMLEGSFGTMVWRFVTCLGSFGDNGMEVCTMLGEFWYNGMEVCIMLGEFWYNDMEVCTMFGGGVFGYGGFYHVMGVLVQLYGGCIIC